MSEWARARARRPKKQRRESAAVLFLWETGRPYTYLLASCPISCPRSEEKMYKGQSGMWSWLLHRITGLGILLFLFIHIVDISLLGFGPQVYNDGILLFDSIIVRLLSLALIGAILLHATNGVRIMLIDFWSKGVRYQRSMFVVVVAITIIAFIPTVYFVLAPKLFAPVVAWFFTIKTH